MLARLSGRGGGELLQAELKPETLTRRKPGSMGGKGGAALDPPRLLRLHFHRVTRCSATDEGQAFSVLLSQ